MSDTELEDRLQDEADDLIHQYRELAQHFGFRVVAKGAALKIAGPSASFWCSLTLHDGEEKNDILSYDDRMEMFVKKLSKSLADQAAEGLAFWINKAGHNGVHKHEPSTAADFSKELYDQIRSQPQFPAMKHQFNIGWNQQLSMGDDDLTEAKVTKTWLGVDGKVVDTDEWRHDLRREFHKLYEPFDVSNIGAPRFHPHNNDIAEFGGKFLILFDPEGMFSMHERGDMLVKAIAKKLCELIDRGFMVKPVTGHRQGLTKTNRPTTEQMATELEPRMRFGADPRAAGTLFVSWIVVRQKDAK